jgi:nucleotide-binding universal stress UspA family protein
MRDIDRILCPVDLSDASKHAFDHAAVLAGWYASKIIVLHVCNPVFIPSGEAVGLAMPPTLTYEERKAIRQQLIASLQPMTADAEVIVESGPVPYRILEHAKTLPADLIVIGTHGAGGFTHLILGSVTEKVIRQATCPVLTVPPKAWTRSALPFKRLLCPVDFSDSSLAALERAFSIAQESDADLTLLHAFEWTPDDEPLTNRPISVPEFRGELERELTARLEALIPDSVRTWCRPVLRIVHGKAYRQILDAAVEENADLIVMGVHGRNALEQMLFGSTTNQVVRRATCPVLTVR